MKQIDKINRLGFNSFTEYRNHIAKRNGYRDYNEYRKEWRAKRNSNKIIAARVLSDLESLSQHPEFDSYPNLKALKEALEEDKIRFKQM